MNKKWLAIAAAAYTMVFFILTGNLGLIKGFKAGFMTSEGLRFSKNYILTKYMTTGTLQVACIFIAIGMISIFYFLDKEEQFKLRLESKVERIKYFKETMIMLAVPVVVAIIFNFLIRSGMFIAGQEIFSLELGIEYFSVISTYLYVLGIAFAGIPVSFLFQVGVKSKLIAGMLPVLMAEAVIMVIGVSNVFTTGAFASISNKVSVPILYLANMLAYDYRVEILGSKVFGITLLSLIAFGFVCMAITCRLLVSYDLDSLKLTYRFTWLRRLIILGVIPLFTIYLLLTAFCSYSMFVYGSMSLDRAYALTNLLSVILVPLLCVGCELLYMKNNNITNNKKVKKSIKKVNDDLKKTNNNEVKNAGQEIDDFLESKGILKETILVEHEEEELNISHDVESEVNLDDSAGDLFMTSEEENNEISLELLREEVNKVLEEHDTTKIEDLAEIDTNIEVEEDDFFTIKRDK
ncbi:MAG: hypothetical protein ACRC41_09200 [Sarcina sp.]